VIRLFESSLDQMPADEKLLTLPQLAEAAGVGYRTIHSWLQRGLISPTLQASRGPGTPNLFVSEDAVRARAIAELRRAGVGLEALALAAQRLGETEPVESESVLVVNGTVDLVPASVSLDSILEGGEPAVVYKLASARQAVADYLQNAAGH
jgi:DNA-binding transcriptional MerR regulator